MSVWLCCCCVVRATLHKKLLLLSQCFLDGYMANYIDLKSQVSAYGWSVYIRVHSGTYVVISVSLLSNARANLYVRRQKERESQSKREGTLLQSRLIKEEGGRERRQEQQHCPQRHC